jgi:hypothetical protein
MGATGHVRPPFGPCAARTAPEQQTAYLAKFAAGKAGAAQVSCKLRRPMAPRPSCRWPPWRWPISGRQAARWRQTDRSIKPDSEYVMTTKLEKPLKRELAIDGEAFIVMISPEGLKITRKGKRKGQELTWKDLISGQAALATALNASLDEGGSAD